VDAGNYDDVDDPFMSIFYSRLAAYIEKTIDVYNSITETDIENALDKHGARYTGVSVPVTDVGKYSSLTLVGSADDGYYNNAKHILETRWRQGDPYNAVIMERLFTPNGYTYVAGCGAVAIGQIMAFHGNKKMEAGGEAPHSNTSRYSHIVYDWKKMISDPDDKDVRYSVAVLMYEIGLGRNANSIYIWGSDGSKEGKSGSASTATTRGGVINAFKNMGYQDPGSFNGYNFLLIKYSINGGCPVLAGGSASGIDIFGLSIATPINGHYWVIDGYRRMAATTKNDKSTVPKLDTDDYVHCNMGWDKSTNGWYISGVFDAGTNPDDGTSNIPLIDDDDGLPRSATQDNFYQYGLGILTFIRPK
jgi:hypothetical protein